MADRAVYIVGLNKFYLTNKTNVTRLWEVVERELGGFGELEIAWNDQDGKAHIVPARKHKIKSICQKAHRNRILIRVEGDYDHNYDFISIHQDIVGGRD
jgi:hypothetical protein